MGTRRPHRAAARGLRAPRARLGLIARVHPLVTARAVDRAFDYAIPEELADQVAAGSIVRIPLGSREVDGVVDSLGEPAGDDDLKPLIDVTGRVPLPLLELAGWIAEQ